MSALLAVIPGHAAIPAVSELAQARARRAWLAIGRGTARDADCAAMALDALQDGARSKPLHGGGYHRCVGVLIMT